MDIEKSASRTTDPVALADTDNPTLKNAACTVCHRVLDPVAGAFQNYGENGAYREAWGGLDSLDGLYKEGAGSPYVEGDTWYRDMRAPGFDGTAVPDAANSLQWLARRIAEDERFAEGTVKFWWPAVLGVPVAEPPEDQGDSDFAGRLLASNAQAAGAAAGRRVPGGDRGREALQPEGPAGGDRALAVVPGRVAGRRRPGAGCSAARRRDGAPAHARGAGVEDGGADGLHEGVGG